MSTENLDKGVNIPDSQESFDDWAPSDFESKQMEGGWRPKHEWEGDPEAWVSAKEFAFRGELMDRITQLGRKVGGLEELNAKLSKMVAKGDQVTQEMAERAYKQAVKDLKAERRAAIREGDDDRVEQIEESLEELDSSRSQMQAAADAANADVGAPQPSAVQLAWFNFVTNTKWAQQPNINRDLLSYAEGLIAENPTIEVDQFMEGVLDKGKELRGLKRAAPAGPDDGGKAGARTRSANRGGKFSAKDLNAQQKQIGTMYVEDGVIESLDEYAKMLGKENGLDSQRGF
jgi:hypothetical protein